MPEAAIDRSTTNSRSSGSSAFANGSIGRGSDGVLLVDARCLQDPAYRERGIGQHAEALLRRRPAAGPKGQPIRLVAVLDPSLPPPLPRVQALFDDAVANGYAAPPDTAWFVSLSPMTHDSSRTARLLARRAVGRRRWVTAALVYDFIPLDYPQYYLSDQASKLAYEARLNWLLRGGYDLFAPISEATAARLRELLPISAAGDADPAGRGVIAVTGVAVRPGLIPTPGNAGRVLSAAPHFLVVAGPDWRKNVEAAIVAHAGSTVFAEAGVPLLIAGNYPAGEQTRLEKLHAEGGGARGLLHFLPHMDDVELRAAYAGAVATLAPSRSEGFSIPIVEASANGSPVFAADCAAQVELLGEDSEALFAADDVLRLRALAERAVQDPVWRSALLARQAGLWRRYTEEAVAARFWDALLALPEPAATPGPAVELRAGIAPSVAAPAILTDSAAPRIAVLSPLPPAPSGCADYTYAVLASLRAQGAAPIVFAEAGGEKAPAGVEVRRLPEAPGPAVTGEFDAVVAVMGNSSFHLGAYRELLSRGGACIAHDARLLDFHWALLGPERAIEVAAAELGRPVSMSEVEDWLGSLDAPPALFLSGVLASATTTFFHSQPTLDRVREAYGPGCPMPVAERPRAAALLPFAVYRPWSDPAALAPPARQAARRRLRLAPHVPVVATFGHVIPHKAPRELIWALYLLRGWRIPATLAFVGDIPALLAAPLRTLASELGLVDAVLFAGGVSEVEYRSWLQAADVAVQLRQQQRLGSISGALADCAAAGLPAVANACLADATGVPTPLCTRVPDSLSAVLVAEALADRLEAIGRERGGNMPSLRDEATRLAYCEERSMDRYAMRLLAGLGLAA